MMDDSLTAELERLKAENERLPRARGRTVSLKISEKGGVSVSGLGRFPVTLYKEQWTTFFDMTDEIRAFLTEHGAALQTKSKAEQPGRIDYSSPVGGGWRCNRPTAHARLLGLYHGTGWYSADNWSDARR